PDQVPVKTVTIKGWALAYLKSYSCVGAVNCTGGKGHWEVQVTMVDAIYSGSPGLIGPFNPLSRIAARPLIEQSLRPSTRPIPAYSRATPGPPHPPPPP